MDNNSISPACFRIKGNSSHLARQMHQENSDNRECAGSGESTLFSCEGDQMTCVYFGSRNTGQDEYRLWSDVDYASSTNNSTPLGDSDEDNTYTFVTCARTPVGLSCRMDANVTEQRACIARSPSRVKCHYKPVSKQEDKAKKCPPEWSFHKKRCYRHLRERLTYDKANYQCRQLGAYLVGNENAPVKKPLGSEIDNFTYWIGKPDHVSSPHCYVMNITGNSVISDCNDTHTFVCYKELFKYLQCKGAPDAEDLITTEAITTTEVTTPTSTTTEPTTTKEMVGTTEATTTFISSVTTKSSATKSPAEKRINAARIVFEQSKEQIGDYISQFSNDSSTMEILDNIIEAPPPRPSNDQGSTAAMATEMVENLDNLVDSLAELVSGPGEPLVIESSELVLRVIPLCTTCSSNSPGPALGVELNNDSFTMAIPAQAAGEGATVAMSVVNSLEDAMSTNIEEEEEETLVSSDDGGGNGQRGRKNDSSVVAYEITSLVATVSVKKWDKSDLVLAEENPFEIVFTNKGDNMKDSNDGLRSCCFWKPDSSLKDGGVWSTKGCSTTSNLTHTTCRCTHLTSFAVLMRISQAGAPQSSQAIKIQDYMTYVGCGLSMACLATMLIVFTVQKLYRSDRNIIHMNLASALLISQAVFLFGIERTEIWQVCKTIGASLHFFLLATFFWMLVEGIYLISKTTSTKNRFLKMPVYMAIGWGGPTTVVGITAAVSLESYGIEDVCWLTNENGGIWAFVGPAIAIVATNVILLCQVIRVFLSLKTNMKKAHVERIWLALRAMLLTLPLLGSTWLFGILSFNSHTVFFSYIFIVLNSLQGVFIFVLYCVMNDEVKKVVEKKLSSIGRISGRTSNGRSTKSTS
ncbi:uncharacterized protein [Diadema setosum]|uniref:uncharacterized protein n=1 Tax=Diadema setosum TaxID=31175 RepID=UPI003B3A99BC